MNFEAPKMYCKNCGKVIPTNGERDYGSVYVKTPQLGCKQCAIEAMPPQPKKPRRKRGESDPEQMKIEAPRIFIS